jgi:hypothetical protein
MMTTNQKAAGLAVTVNNDRETYNRRQHLAAMSFSQRVPEYAEIVKEQAAKERAQFKTKYTRADVNEAADVALFYDRQDIAEMMRDKVAAGDRITARGRKWFDKNGGNTYHSVRMTVGGVSVYLSYTYGYDDQWKQTAIDWLVTMGIIETQKYDHGGTKYRELYDMVSWGDAPYGLKREL